MLVCIVFNTYKMKREARNAVCPPAYTSRHNTDLSQQMPEFIPAPVLQGLKDFRGEAGRLLVKLVATKVTEHWNGFCFSGTEPWVLYQHSQ